MADPDVERASALKQEAGELLHAAPVLELLQRRFGKCALVGSFDLNLMTRRDLDISVPLASADFVSVFPELVQCFAEAVRPVVRARYNDEVLRSRGDYGQGLYFGLHITHPNGPDWKLDLWGWPTKLFRTKIGEHQELKRSLQQLDRLLLLRAKRLAAQRPEFGDRLTSYSIYQAALSGSPTDADALVHEAANRF